MGGRAAVVGREIKRRRKRRRKKRGLPRRTATTEFSIFPLGLDAF